MAEFRERPYGQFNFWVNLGTGDTESPQAGFQEVSGLGIEITVSEYRVGNEKDNGVRKITGRYNVPDVTLRRGLIGSLDLYEWLEQVRNGSQDGLRTIRIELRNEDRTATVQTWKLKNARPMKYTGPSLNAQGTDVAIEELVLACERIELE